ncbi:MAG: 30S ribosomal protein S3 [Candidatus Pacebacteria bacterium]|jgi:small subunit ribosomal protein S3|nr:30S ribosomal protein S3 [Candidatus Paceibacterota bacterium]
MGHKVNPFAHRLGVIRGWKSNWFNVANYREYLKNDIELRTYLEKKLQKAAIENIVIERSSNSMTFNISTARPGVVIGRGGTGAEDLRADIVKKVKPEKIDVKINIIEIKNPELSAMLVAQSVAEQLEKRAPFRRTIKQAIERTMQNKTAQGVKVAVSGRLDGAEMARAEWLSEGKIPLQTLRADVDYAKYCAHTTFGVIGIKVWIYKGEIFNRK